MPSNAASPRFSLLYSEYLVEHPASVMQQEYTVQQSIGTMAALALYVGGNEGRAAWR